MQAQEKEAVKIADNARVYKKTEAWKSTGFGLSEGWCDLLGSVWSKTIEAETKLIIMDYTKYYVEHSLFLHGYIPNCVSVEDRLGIIQARSYQQIMNFLLQEILPLVNTWILIEFPRPHLNLKLCPVISNWLPDNND